MLDDLTTETGRKQFHWSSRRLAKVSTMDFSSLNVDVLLYLMKFVDPDDRFNLVLSGILKGFENAIEATDLRERYFEHFTLVQSK
jgi:hypothetical protein